MVTEARGQRANALWGRGGKALVALLAFAAVAAATPVPASAARGKPSGKTADRTPPETTITSGPSPQSLAFGDVTFTFSASEPATFECSVDDAPFTACTGASSSTISNPAAGVHTFRVRAIDLAGNVDATPASVTWNEGYSSAGSYAGSTLFAAAQAHPTQLFNVIVTTTSDRDARRIPRLVSSLTTGTKMSTGSAFTAISGFPATLPGWAVLWLHERVSGATSIIPDRKVKDPLPPEPFAPAQVWPQALGADALWPEVTSAPAIAVIDSGIDSSAVADLGGRVLTHVNLGDPYPNLDDYGHGTFVAEVAAGSASRYPGVAPTANLVDVRVIGANGSGSTSDVIEGIDWVLKHPDEYDIKVVNLSLQSAKAGSFRFDPLDRAVESLWLSGITVVASVGNSGAGAPQQLNFAPANDPFVITVGAADVNGTIDRADDSVPSWSQYGYTADGFAEPTLVAPGRRIVAAVPPGATLPTSLPDRIVEPGYMRLSGTSVATGVVSGSAAQLLALHPSWGPDEVKGALMATAGPIAPLQGQAGAGEESLAVAAAMMRPPNPNAALERYIASDPSAPGGKSFDSATWVEAAKADPTWYLSSYSDASWGEASWVDASWVESAFASASWVDSAQADLALADASWGE